MKLNFKNPANEIQKRDNEFEKSETWKTVPNLGNEFAEKTIKPEEIYNQVRKMLEMLSNTLDNQVQKIDEFQCQT